MIKREFMLRKYKENHVKLFMQNQDFRKTLEKDLGVKHNEHETCFLPSSFM